MLVIAFFMIEPFVFADQTGLSARDWLRPGTVILFVGIILVGIIRWYVARAYHRPPGINLDLLYKTIPPD